MFTPLDVHYLMGLALSPSLSLRINEAEGSRPYTDPPDPVAAGFILPLWGSRPETPIRGRGKGLHPEGDPVGQSLWRRTSDKNLL